MSQKSPAVLSRKSPAAQGRKRRSPATAARLFLRRRDLAQSVRRPRTDAAIPAGYTNRNDNAPANIFSLTSFVLTILKTVSSSPTRAIEYFQDHKNRAIRLLSGFH